MNDPEVRVAPPEDFVRAGVEAIRSRIEAAVAGRGRCAVALAGGSTPEPVYRELARSSHLDWSAVDVYFGDERAVPPKHPESNFGMAREALLARVSIPRAQVHRIPADRPDLEEVAREYGGRLPDALDVLLLGIGEDGHVASLFPGSDALSERRRKCVAVQGPDSRARRVTVTPPVIAGARSVVVLARGRRKARAVREALEGDVEPAACPARLARGGTWILDREAASGLSGRPAGPEGRVPGSGESRTEREEA